VSTESLQLEIADAGSSHPLWPIRLTAFCGDVLIRIDGSKLWTLRGIEWRGTAFGVEDSEYGTVVDYKDEGPIGAGHREIESEVVTGFEATVDGQLLALNSESIDVRAERLRITRQSKIRSFALDAALEVRKDVVVQSVHITTDRAVAVKSLYSLMYAWTPYASEYLFGGDDGTESSGEFQRQEKRYFTESGKRWVAAYDASVRRGVVSYVLAEPGFGDRIFLVADVPKIYRKIYLKCFAESVVPAGFDGAYTVATGFFAVSNHSGWKEEARQRARDLRSQFSC
jgi:hypothetical protein